VPGAVADGPHTLVFWNCCRFRKSPVGLDLEPIPEPISGPRAADTVNTFWDRFLRSLAPGDKLCHESGL